MTQHFGKHRFVTVFLFVLTNDSCQIQGETIEIDFEANTWQCTTTLGNCYGGPINGIGCAVPECIRENNPLGTCGCDEQFFLNSDCTAGFLCGPNAGEADEFDGCYRQCLSGQVLIPDFEDNTWRCIDVDVADFDCPGKFNLFCPDDMIGGDFDSAMCDCNGQLLVSNDCKESFYCLDRLPGGGAALNCENEGEIVELDFFNHQWECTNNTGNCPGLGGFALGCQGGGIGKN